MTRPFTPAEVWSPETDPEVIARRKATAEEYGQWVATQEIYHGTALAYREGDPVPVSNVELHGYDKAGLVERVTAPEEVSTQTTAKAATAKGK